MKVVARGGVIASCYQAQWHKAGSGIRKRANSIMLQAPRNALANTISKNDEYGRLEKYNEVFSYLGNQNNQPG